MFVDNDSAHDAEPVRGTPVVALVVRARGGDERAWAALVERYAPLIWSLCRRYRLDTTDIADVGQNVWLLLVDQLGKIRDPAALPGWLATTTRRECQRVLNKAQVPHAARHEPDAENIPDGQAETIEQELLAAGRHAALREAFTHLPPRDQQLITLLIEDPPVPYAQISARLGIPAGSIGPNRRRCLDKLRHHPAIAKLTSAEAKPHNDRSRAVRTSQAPVVAYVQIEGGYRVMAAASGRHVARLVFQSASVLIAESVLPAVVKAEIATQHISTLSWAASLALLDLSGDCLIRLLRAGPW